MSLSDLVWAVVLVLEAGFFGAGLVSYVREGRRQKRLAPPFDLNALRRVAAERFGVTKRISVTYSDAPLRIAGRTDDRTCGTYLCEWDFGMVHRIELRVDRSPTEILQSLAHELVHAAQAEREGSVRAWRRRSKREHELPYDERPIELEARIGANKWPHLGEIVVA